MRTGQALMSMMSILSGGSLNLQILVHTIGYYWLRSYRVVFTRITQTLRSNNLASLVALTQLRSS
jgi:hypothetical protein